MRNITITLDNDTAARARVEAAERGMSLSRYVGEMLRAQLKHDDAYEAAHRRFLAMKPVRLKRPGGRYLTREEAHDRAGLRRR
jgi:plasmid stability protein